MSLRAETVDIAVDADHIAGTLFMPSSDHNPAPGVLFIHGWGGHQQQDRDAARAIAEFGCVCLTFDLRGHVKTSERRETVTREDHLREALAAYDGLTDQAGFSTASC